MTEVVKQEGAGVADTVKLWAAAIVAVAGVTAFYLLKGEQANWVRWLVFAAALLLAAGVFAWSGQGRSAWRFVLDSRVELYKVFWPTRQETGMTTLVVFGFVVIMGLFFWALDTLLAWVTSGILGTGSGG
jgi:preprotein translocase subunit SecE